MLIFFFIVLIYGTANLYVFSKLVSLLNYGAWVDAVIGSVVLFMAISPVLIAIYSNRGSERSVRMFSYTGYMWLALLVPFFPLSVVFDLYNFLILELGSGAASVLSEERGFYISLVLSVAITVYGYFEAQYLKTERLVFRTSKLPDGIERIRAVQVSDLHLGVIVGDKMLKRVIKKVEDETPDIIVSTGDLIDTNIRHIKDFAARLEAMHAPLGKFAVMGNHEVYAGARHSVRFIEDAGFKLLRGEGVTVNDSVNIAGMDFLGGEARGYSRDSGQRPEHEILSILPRDLFTVLLKHRSDVEKKSLGLFDLQLSGHTHKGQIFPMNLATMFIFPHHTGLTKLAKGSMIYTSRGTGTAGPPIRFLSRPEVTVIDIIKG